MINAVWNSNEFHVLKLVTVVLLLYVGVRRFWTRWKASKDDEAATMTPVDRTIDGKGDMSSPDDRGRFNDGGGNYRGKVSWQPEGMFGSVGIDDKSTFVGLQMLKTTYTSGWWPRCWT